MIRVAFNGGELSPQVQMRGDLDVFQRGCMLVENFDIDQAGGVSRRRGFRQFARAQGEASRLFAYRYSNAERYLVEVSPEELRVYGVDGALVWSCASGYSAAQVKELRSEQINSLLLFVCANRAPMQLRCDEGGEWSFEAFSYKVPAWRYSAWRDQAVYVLSEDGQIDGRPVLSVSFAAGLTDGEQAIYAGDELRVSYYTEGREIKLSQTELFELVDKTYEARGEYLFTDEVIRKGTVFAVLREPEVTYYTAMDAWKGSELFIEGLIEPANYTADFQVATAPETEPSVMLQELTKANTFTKGQIFGFRRGYWDLFTCVKNFDRNLHSRVNKYNPEDYPGHFVRGCMMGAVPCGGKWKLHLHGTWYGSYEVRATYETQTAQGADRAYNAPGVSEYSPWETRAEAWSRNAAPVNEPVGGDEGGEECFISLWLTRVRAYGSELTARCFPSDLCENALVVSSYKHDMVLRAEPGEYREAQRAMFTLTLTASAVPSGVLTYAIVYELDGNTVRIDLTGSLELVVSRINENCTDVYAELIDETSIAIYASEAGATGNQLEIALTAKGLASYSVEQTVLGKDERFFDFCRVERVQPEFAGELQSNDWSWCAWSERYGYPSLVGMYNQRLVLSGTLAQPLTIWLSQTDDLDNFAVTDEDTSAMALTLNASTQDPIRWLVPQGGRIMLGTSEGEYVVQAGDGGVMTNTNAVVTAHGFVGAAAVAAIRGSDRIIYFERGGGRVMQYGYDQSQDAYISTDLTVYAEHVLADGGGVVEGCFLRKPDCRAVMVMANGQLAMMTYNAHHRVNAWHRYITAGRFLSVAMLPNGDKPDSLYAIVQRGDEAWIETMDEQSGYEDGAGLDYTSTLLTNALQVTSLGSAKRSNPELYMYVHEALPVQGVRLTVNGGDTWTKVPRHQDTVLERGWHKLVAVPQVDMERCVGFRCSGNQGMSVGAIQA